MKLSAIQIGRICLKTRGREAGKKCVIVDIIDKSFVVITGPKALTGVKRRRANVNHLQPLDDLIQIPKGIEDDDMIKVLEENEKKDYMKTEEKI